MPTLLLLGGVVLAAAFALSRQRQRAGRLAQPPQAATARTVTAHSLRQQQAALPSLAEAEQVVRSWQVGRPRGACRENAVRMGLALIYLLKSVASVTPGQAVPGSHEVVFSLALYPESLVTACWPHVGQT